MDENATVAWIAREESGVGGSKKKEAVAPGWVGDQREDRGFVQGPVVREQ